MITMLLGGLWHGADWKFVFWGGMHGLALAVGRLQRDLQVWLKRRRGQPHIREGKAKRKVGTQPAFRLLRKPLGILLTFHFVCFCWIFFRAESFDLGMEMLYQIAYAFRPEIWRQWIEGYPEVLGLILLGYLLHFMPARWDRSLTRGFVKAPALVQSVALALIIWLVIQTRSAEVQPFIYFQF
jgi:D-alanyl-lipoteichoic acid acyltransferase DltB (MBOAT superfamily)